MTLSVSLWADRWARAPVARSWSVARLLDVLSTPRVCTADARPAWSPTRYQPGATRGAAAVEALSCVVLDYDDGTDVDEAVRPWGAVTCHVHTTYSHRHAAPRLRLTLPLASEVPASSWARAWAWVAGRAAGRIDRACCDASRIYFLPAVSSRRADWWFGAFGPDRLLDVPADLPPTPEELEHARRVAEARRRASELARRDDDRARQERLKLDPDAREALGVTLGGAVGGVGASRAVRRVTCPACGRASVWWPVVPRTTPQAMCQHRGSCGWTGWLDTLEVA